MSNGEPSARVPSELFVGREEQLEEFKKILKPESEIRILNIHSNGDGGIGKTQLLLRMQEYCDSAPTILFTKELIDCYHTETHSKIGIFHQIVNNLGKEKAHFLSCGELIDEYYHTKDTSIRQGMFPQLKEAFKSDYATFTKMMEGKVVVLFFDTYEVIQGDEEFIEGKKVAKSTELSHWLESELFPLFAENENTRIVVSGRYPVRDVDLSQPYAKVLNLEQLSFEEALIFWQRCFNIASEDELYELLQRFNVNSKEQLKTIYELTDGRPIFLALLTDWINYSPKRFLPFADELLKKTKQEFERLLIEQTSSLVGPENKAVTLMSIAYHRMTPEMFHFLLRDYPIPIEECRRILLKRMRPLSFVKFKKDDVVILHDELRRLVIEHLWRQHDPERIMRTEIAADIVDFYDTTLLKNDTLAEELRETYTSEVIEYAFFARMNEGLERFCSEFDIAIEDGRYDYCNLLLREVERYHRDNPKDIPFPYFLEIDLRQIEYHTHAEPNYEKAIKRAKAILEKYQETRLELTIQSFDDLKEKGIPDNLLEDLGSLQGQEFTHEHEFCSTAKKLIGQEKLDKYKKLILGYASKGFIEWNDSKLQARFWLSKGIAELWDGDYQRAIESLKQAEEVFYNAGVYDWLPQTNNMIGYTYYRQGHFVEAEHYLEQSRDGFYRSLVQLERKKELQPRERRRLIQGLQLALGNLAGVHSYTGEFGRAVRKAEVILNIVRHLPRNTLEIARTRTSVGHATLYAGHTIDARHHFIEAERLLQHIRNRLLTGRIKTELGFLEYREDELAYLLEYYRAEEIEGIITNDRFVKQEAIKKAKKLLNDAITVLQGKPEIKKELADAYYILAELYMVDSSKNHWENAEKYFLESLKWGRKSKFRYRVSDTLESLVTLYYFWSGASEVTPEVKEETERKMLVYQQELEGSEEYRQEIYPEIFAKYAVTLGDIQFDKALELLPTLDGEDCEPVMSALKKAFTHYVSAVELMEGFNEKRYYLILRVFYNRLKALIDRIEKKRDAIDRLNGLRSKWASKTKRFEDIYQGVLLSFQLEGKQEKIADIKDHIQKVLEKGNFGWAALLNECLIGGYRALTNQESKNDNYREQLIVRLNAQSRLYRILGDLYQSEQNINAARKELSKVSNTFLKEALEGYTDSCEGTSEYRKGEYTKPLEFYLRDELKNARENKFDQQFPRARANALRLLQNGEQKLSSAVTYWKTILIKLDDGEEKTFLEERIQGYHQKLGETRFRLGELLMLNEQFDDINGQKGTLSYLKEAVRDCEDSGNTYYYYYAMQSYVNALYFAGRYDRPEFREKRFGYEQALEKNRRKVQPSIMGRLRITQGDALFSNHFQRKDDQITGDYTYVSQEGGPDSRILKKMWRCYVEACSFMIENSGAIQFDDIIRTVQRRIELIGDKNALQMIQHDLRDVWHHQVNLRGDAIEEELKTLDQFARIKGLVLQ